MMMAQTSSAQREPSMEEILASIRRIIEDSDTMRQPFEEAERAQLSLDAEIARDAEIAGVQQQVEEFRAELNAPQATDDGGDGDVFIPPAMPKPVTGMAERLPEVTLPPPPQVKAETMPFDVAAPGEAAEPAIDEAQPETSLHRGGIEDDGDQPDPMSAEGRATLISDQAGRQVAAAFGELSEAFAASRRRSFDDMAEEMLRPMLQDWLDNNLPTLVERLVREEIERVARGG